ncbi:prolyl oligopeptidase family serine peptidase [Sphingomonas sp. CFBP 8764]|uniref:prolyl oligopeptidase family serine peptidase n=1 Tax=Sphingomonas sp. CFBP 8764 TaxID=2775275 RepID=UPI001782A518|nr:prolyl oligopeptidase family serine peptidase [Sphingomonas sp. CFBP 8764]MBD8552640.1 prolyl oligopeptidase family serine peptidase [Sphingomonas sp. CFBP 8764]
MLSRLSFRIAFSLGMQMLCSPAVASDRPNPAPVQAVTDDYYGTKVVDPYRWMENGKDPRWMPWLKAQATAARHALDAIPARERFLASAKALSGDLATVQKVVAVGQTQFIQRRKAGAEDSILVARTGNAPERMLVDPAKIGGGDQVLDWWQTSSDGRYVAVGLSKRGSEASVLHIVETASARLLPDRIPNTDFGVVGWLPDNSGFTYLTFVGQKGTPSYYINSEPRLHLLGTSAPDRLLINRAKSPVPLGAEQFATVSVTSGSKSAVLAVEDGRREQALYRTDIGMLSAGPATWTRISDFNDLVVGAKISGDNLWLLSRKGNSNGTVILTSASKPNLASARQVVIPGNPVLESISATKSGALVQTIEGGQSGLWRVSISGAATRVALPVSGTVRWIENEPTSDTAYVSLAGWFTPARPYKLLADNTVQDTGLVQAPRRLDPSRYEVRTLTATARDGTTVPYTVVMRKDITSNGRNPLLIEAYGAYGISLTPDYQSQLIPFLDLGGVFVTANVRGGGEFGRSWHYAGKAETKANTWHDAIDVAEALVKNKLTSPKHMTIMGTSGGGVMVGQAINERPDLFNGAIANVGFMNPIRYVSEQNFADIQEWGGPITDAKSFKTMFDLDPYEHIRPGVRYPATLVVSGINDPRAATFHSAKYAAKLAAGTTSGEPVLLRIDFDAGHGVGSTRPQREELWTDIYSFALWRGGSSEFQPK